MSGKNKPGFFYHFCRFRGFEERSPCFQWVECKFVTFAVFVKTTPFWQGTKTRFTKNTVCATPIMDVRAFGLWTSAPTCLFFQDFEGLTEVFAPGHPPGHPRGRPPDIRPQNLLFGLLFAFLNLAPKLIMNLRLLWITLQPEIITKIIPKTFFHVTEMRFSKKIIPKQFFPVIL